MQNREKPVYFFIHIPKTAGTTAKIIIEWLYRWEEIFWARGDKYIQEKVKKLSAKDLNKIRIVAGHTPFGMHNYFYFPNFKYFTFLRDPVERVISQYHYMRQKPGHPYGKIVNNPHHSFEYLLENNYLPNTYNVQTRWLTGGDIEFFKKGRYDPEVVRETKSNIESYFSIVGLNEYFDESLLVMKRKLDWDWPMYAKKNVSKKDKKSQISERALQIIKETNQMDIEIYDYCKQRFLETLEKERDEQFDKDLAYLRKLNQSVGRYKLYRIKFIKDFIHKTLKEKVTGKERVDIWP